MKITREQAICIMRRVMDRAELDGALHLDAGADEIVAGLALLQGRRVETAPKSDWQPFKVRGLTYEYDRFVYPNSQDATIVTLFCLEQKCDLPPHIRIHPAEADRYDPPKEATATEMRMRLDEYKRSVAVVLRKPFIGR